MKKAIQKELKYKPYNGGAGPDFEQVKHNDAYLEQELKKLGFKVVRTEHPNVDELEVLKVGDYFVSFDRWGYCLESMHGSFLDQANPEEVLQFLLKHRPLKKGDAVKVRLPFEGHEWVDAVLTSAKLKEATLNRDEQTIYKFGYRFKSKVCRPMLQGFAILSHIKRAEG